MTLTTRSASTTRQPLLRALAAAGVLAAILTACSDDNADAVKSEAAPSAPAVEAAPTEAAEISQVRAATAAFADVDMAKAAGYTVWSPDPAAAAASCPTTPEGKMGYHLVNPALRGTPPKAAEADATIDSAKPEQLLYQKKSDGTMELVGVEYLVFKAAWERENGAGAAGPKVLGEPVPASKHAFAPGGPEVDHYELHVWLHSDNPQGMFAAYNPNITC